MKEKTGFAKWIEIKYIEWMKEKEQIHSQREFADYLGIDAMSLSHYINARRKMPDQDSIKKIASKLGPEVYDVLGLARPDADLKQVTAVWHKLNDQTKHRILEIAETSYNTNEEK